MYQGDVLIPIKKASQALYFYPILFLKIPFEFTKEDIIKLD